MSKRSLVLWRVARHLFKEALSLFCKRSSVVVKFSDVSYPLADSTCKTYRKSWWITSVVYHNTATFANFYAVSAKKSVVVLGPVQPLYVMSSIVLEHLLLVTYLGWETNRSWCGKAEHRTVQNGSSFGCLSIHSAHICRVFLLSTFSYVIRTRFCCDA